MVSGGKDGDSGAKGGLGGASAERTKPPAAGPSAGGTEPIAGARSGPAAGTAQPASGTDAITPEIPPGKLGGASGAAEPGSQGPDAGRTQH